VGDRDWVDRRTELDGGRSEAQWAALSGAELAAEWDAPRPEKLSREDFRRLARVRSEMFARGSFRPPDGVTYGAAKERRQG
jgi:hypothetical protein